jgi:DNA/RNA-binding domain of Phe-tRNA-synthetase-like protein
MTLTPNEYQRRARTTAFPYLEAAHDIAQDPVLAEEVIRKMYTALGLGESGENQEVTKKHIRSMRQAGNAAHTLTYEQARAKKLDEAGDQMWYIANDLEEWDLTLEEAMENNLAKLQVRMNSGTLAVENRPGRE